VQPDAFTQICNQIHEIRNFLSPLDLKLVSLEQQVNDSRTAFNLKTTELETKINATAFRVEEHAARMDEYSSEMTNQSERIKRLESLLLTPQNVAKTTQAPVHEDKANPSILPPQTPSV